MASGQQVQALGYQALAELNWRQSGLGRDEAAATPAVREQDRLIAAPLLKSHPQIGASPLRDAHHFSALLYTH